VETGPVNGLLHVCADPGSGAAFATGLDATVVRLR
jgi:hypothetical protein